MNIQSWMIKSWATLEWYLPPETDKLPRFNLVGTQIRDDGSATGLRAGDTVWVAEGENADVGLAWEWIEVQPGIVMLADPNSIITNLQFVDSFSAPVSGLARTIAVNRIVHALPWQLPVCAQLRDTVADLTRRVPALEQRLQLQTLTERYEQHAATAAELAPRPRLQNLNWRALVDAPGRAHSRSSDCDADLDRRGLRDLRRAA